MGAIWSRRAAGGVASADLSAPPDSFVFRSPYSFLAPRDYGHSLGGAVSFLAPPCGHRRAIEAVVVPPTEGAAHNAELNLHLGIAHQGLSPRALVLGPTTVASLGVMNRR